MYQHSVFFIVPFATFVSENNKDSRHVFLSNCYLSSNPDHNVYFLTSSFSHSLKEQRRDSIHSFYNFRLYLCFEPGYIFNSSLARFFSNIILQFSIIIRFLKLFFLIRSTPVFILCTFPFEFLSLFFTLFGRLFSIPVYVDIQDIWPFALTTVIRPPFRYFFYPFLFPSYIAAQSSFFLCNYLFAVSSKYLSYSWFKRMSDSSVYYLGSDLPIDIFPLPPAYRVRHNTIKLVYSGSISDSYDLKTLVAFVTSFNSVSSLHIQLYIAGSGSLTDSKHINFNQGSIFFLGQISQSSLFSLYSTASVVVNPLHLHAYQDINNRVCDFVLLGIPILSTKNYPELYANGFADIFTYHDFSSFCEAITSIVSTTSRQLNVPSIHQHFSRSLCYYKWSSFLTSRHKML